MSFSSALTDKIELDDLRALKLSTSPLLGFDADKDGSVTASEVDYSVRLKFPGYKSSFTLTDEDDFKAYATLVAHAKTIRGFLPANPSTISLEENSTATWIMAGHRDFTADAPRFEESVFGLEVLDSRREDGASSFLIMDKELSNDGYGGYFFTLHFHENTHELSVEIGGQTYDLTADEHPDFFKKWRAEILIGIFTLFQGAPETQAFGATIRDFAEGLMLGANRSLFLSGLDASLPAAAQAPEVPENIAARIKSCQDNAWPQRLDYVTAAGAPLIVRSETPLSAEESTRLKKVFADIPREIWDALEHSGRLKGLHFEIIEEELIPYWQPAKWSGLYVSVDDKIYLSRRELNHDVTSKPRSILIHELAHRTEFTYDTQSFLPEYYRRTATTALYAYGNPAVSPGALINEREFLAESVAAYFNGEIDAAPIIGCFYGIRSRSELRAKHPELYLAIRLFFAPGNPWFGDKEIFSQNTYQALRRLAQSAETKYLLEPAASVAEIANKLKAL